MRSSNERCAWRPRAIISRSGVFVIADLDDKDWITFFVKDADETMVFHTAIHTPFLDSGEVYSGIYRSIMRFPPAPPLVVKLRWIHLLHLLSPFVPNRRKMVVRNGVSLSCRISDRRAYTLPLAMALRRKRHSPSFKRRTSLIWRRR